MKRQSNLPFTSRYLITEKFKLHYIQKGSGDPLILLHGGGTWLYSFRHNIASLSRNFSVYALDMPGHGYTEPLETRVDYNFDIICNSLTEFMDKMNIKKAHMAGHSWGGGWAVCFADRHSMRVDKLILIDSSGINHHERLMWEMMKYPVIGEIMLWFRSRNAIKKGLCACYYNTALVSSDMVDLIYTPLCKPHIRKAQLSYSRNINWKETEAALSRIQSPTLVIWGKQDRYIHVKFAKRIQRKIPDARLVTIDNCGHSAHEECPEVVNSLILKFIEGKEPGENEPALRQARVSSIK